MDTDGRELKTSIDAVINPDANDYSSLHVKFSEDKAELWTRFSNIEFQHQNVENLRETLKASLDNSTEIAAAAQRVAEIASAPHLSNPEYKWDPVQKDYVTETEPVPSHTTVLNLDMSLQTGTGIVVRKALKGIALSAAVEAFSNIGLAQSNPGMKRISDYLSAHEVRTAWDQETQRAADFIYVAAKKFKEDHPCGKVIVVGHSAFTEAIARVPTKWKNQQLIDMRILSSPRTKQLPNVVDPQHTIFVTHPDDLPGSSQADVWNNKSYGDLEEQGTVVQIQDYEMGDPILAHSLTQKIDLPFTLKVIAGGETKLVRGRVWDISEIQIKAAETVGKTTLLQNGSNQEFNYNRGFGTKFFTALKASTPQDSRVGGISLSLAAKMPLDPSNIESLNYATDGDFYFLTSDGKIVWLPEFPQYRLVQTIECIYGNTMPEVSLAFPRKEQDGLWSYITYKSGYLIYTQLGDDLIKADYTLRRLAFYNTNIGLPNHRSYQQLCFDNQSFKSGNWGSRVWLTPSKIEIENKQNQLKVKECQMAFTSEAFEMATQEEYFKGKGEGLNDTAGNCLARELTENYDKLEKYWPDLTAMKKLAPAIGIVLWAKQNHIPIGQTSRARIEVDFRESRKLEQTEEHLWTSRKGEIPNGVYQAIEVEPPSNITEADLQPPMPVFGEYGMTRYLWKDGSTSKLNYTTTAQFDPVHSHMGRPGSLIELQGRKGNKYRLLYDKNSQLLGIFDKNNLGVVAINTTTPPLIAEGVVYKEKDESIRFTRATTLIPVHDTKAMLQEKIAKWYEAEANIDEKSESTDNWLFSSPLDWQIPEFVTIIIASLIGLVVTRMFWAFCLPAKANNLLALKYNLPAALLICLASGILGGFVGISYVVGAAGVSLIINLLLRHKLNYPNKIGLLLWLCYSILLATLAAATAGFVNESPAAWFADWASQFPMIYLVSGAAVGLILHLLLLYPTTEVRGNKEKSEDIEMMLAVAGALLGVLLHVRFNFEWMNSFLLAAAATIATLLIIAILEAISSVVAKL